MPWPRSERTAGSCCYCFTISWWITPRWRSCSKRSCGASLGSDGAAACHDAVPQLCGAGEREAFPPRDTKHSSATCWARSRRRRCRSDFVDVRGDDHRLERRASELPLGLALRLRQQSRRAGSEHRRQCVIWRGRWSCSRCCNQDDVVFGAVLLRPAAGRRRRESGRWGCSSTPCRCASGVMSVAWPRCCGKPSKTCCG